MIKYKQFCGTEGKGVVSQPRTLNTLFDKSAHFFFNQTYSERNPGWV